MTKPNGKVYEGVLYQLKVYIEENQLSPGDKLPSECELSEQLGVGRSSIREAFRAMELLGLIETRRGEGTYMRSYRPYHMVELLSNFLLTEKRTKKELLTAMQMIEKEVLMILQHKLDSHQLRRLKDIIEGYVGKERHYHVFEYLSSTSEQELLFSMWQFIAGFTNTVHNVHYDKSWYESVAETLQKGDTMDIIQLYR
ncbi:FadR/GntR family transcriptional regulator [Halobacillus litoralis]|uniref:FadR/GntR family transcriptional regulator n=1 Tax=Halobacillus litoralis TaxID=45668 RepID=UPI00136960A1|nr:GntR family transcriptional regulator [Halobacillus litoralis]MYL38983.1 GntR family transcriptional regulator [Halobacillus litoralis]